MSSNAAPSWVTRRKAAIIGGAATADTFVVATKGATSVSQWQPQAPTG
jgi:hypothetical protein